MTALEPGLRLTDRYRIEELLLDVDGVRSWRAVDEVLDRSVLVQSVPRDDPRTPELMSAAQAAAMVADGRFLRVLDVGSLDGSAYVIREWLAGANLTNLLLRDGPLEPEHAGALAQQVADALRSAHEQGLCHLALTTDAVIVGMDGSVKVTGLATEAVLRELRTVDPAEADARGVGRVLYATLTGCWPADPEDPGSVLLHTIGLRPAPRVEGHLPSPRQVRAGVPRPLDEVADRILGTPPRHGAAPLSTPADVATALAAVLGSRASQRLQPARASGLPAPALVDVPPLAEPPTEQDDFRTHTIVPPRTGPARPRPPQRRSQLRVLGVVTAMVVLVGAALLGLQLLLQAVPGASDDDGADGADTAAEPTGAPLTVVAAQDYDPLGNGSESPGSVALAFDGDPTTAWTTSEYYDPLERQKPGVGLVLDLGEVREVAGVQLTLVNGGGDLEVRAAGADATSVPGDLDGWQAPVAVTDVEQEAELAFEEPVSTRWVLVWFTRLPQAGANYRDGIAEAALVAP